MNIFDGKHLPVKKALVFVILTSATYNIAVIHTSLTALLPLYFLCLIYISKVEKLRYAFYLGWIATLISYSIHIRFFLNIFGNGSIILWIILSFWPALFVVLSRILLYRTSKKVFLTSIPCLFFLIEVICAEIYPLKFSWIAAGYMTAPNSAVYGLKFLGIYGFSLAILALTLLIETSPKRKYLLPMLCIVLAGLSFIQLPQQKSSSGPRITGIQLEFPEQIEAILGLDKAKDKYPDTDIFMLSEYTFDNGIPQPVLDWCRKNKTYLLAGTKFKTEDGQNFYNTATLVNPRGEIEFKQVKAQPIQFFKDGLPAPKQTLWNSPWGKIGMCICYDLSYTSIIDNLVDLGAEGLLVPTMDVESWGKSEHMLHSRVAPLRAAEYGLPIFKVASSGESQSVNSKGQIIAQASFPGQGEIISDIMVLTKNGAKPLDRYIFWPCAVICLFAFYKAFTKRKEITSSEA
ncbi:MAG: hypothetical protein NE330_10425 [Lentisphaeraceae bacterium]|nr:hypothetical protein [Lentisphaeraceae bacterium]